jgi:hypothetical protein
VLTQYSINKPDKEQDKWERLMQVRQNMINNMEKDLGFKLPVIQ